MDTPLFPLIVAVVLVLAGLCASIRGFFGHGGAAFYLAAFIAVLDAAVRTFQDM